MSIIAIQRGEETIANPKAETTIGADDILVTLGTRDEQQAFSELVETEATDDSQT